MLTLALLAPVARDAGPDTTADAAADAGPVTAGHSPSGLPRTAGTLTTELTAAAARVDAYWTTQGAGPVPDYRSPSLRPAPDGLSGHGTRAPVCAGTRLRLEAAAYCPDGRYVAFVHAFMARGYATLGRAWVYVVVAHEWGHAVQQHLPRTDVDVFRELQADCLAGVALRHVGRDVSVRLGPPDTRARGFGPVARVFALVGSHAEPSGAAPGRGSGTEAGSGPEAASSGPAGPPSFVPPSRPDEPLPGQHGTVAERVSAFADGWHGGTEACLAPAG